SQQIIGVLRDFNYESLHEKIKPIVLSLKFDTIARQSDGVSFANEPLPRISVRMRAGDPAANVAILRDAWKRVAPDQEFDYRFLDETLAKSYQQEYKTARIVSIASGLSIFIACMGLFGLATLTVSRRAKEVGIRRVLGATGGQVVILISTEFIILIGVASLISFPVAWWGLQQWLTEFAYRAPLGWWVFAGGAAAAMVIGFGTIAIQALRAAAANPSTSLRTE
ncbi:MAG TPA: FtsX-like permease family protein, partial [Chitinophagaceae bacterium]